MIGYESIQVYATLLVFPSGASHSHNIIYYFPPASRPPSKKEPPRWRVLYRITRQLLHRVSTASFESCRVHFHWNIRLLPARPG
jgi:hypothetical protein